MLISFVSVDCDVGTVFYSSFRFSSYNSPHARTLLSINPGVSAITRDDQTKGGFKGRFHTLVTSPEDPGPRTLSPISFSPPLSYISPRPLFCAVGPRAFFSRRICRRPDPTHQPLRRLRRFSPVMPETYLFGTASRITSPIIGQ